MSCEQKIIGIGDMPLSGDQRESLCALIHDAGGEAIGIQGSGDQQRAAAARCDALIGQFEPDVLRAATQLKWLQVAPAGVERYMKPGALPNEYAVVTNGSGAYGIAISEYMLGAVLMLMRRMPIYMENQRQHKWARQPGIQTIHGCSATVVGMGNLGTCFAERLAALGAHVTGVRRSAGSAHPKCFEQALSVDQLDMAIADADLVALCLPHTPETNQLFDEARIARMKQGALIVNVGRGTALDGAALAAAIRGGKLGGAVLDVTDPEPLPPESELWDVPNLIVTPHISGLDRDNLAASIVNDIFRENVGRYLRGEALMNVVDAARGY